MNEPGYADKHNLVLENHRLYKQRYDNEHRDAKRAYDHQYSLGHKAERQARLQSKRKTDLQYRLSTTLRARLGRAVNGGYKSGSAVQDLGCSIPELRAHLESQFQPGMTWDNWTVDGWHIDHIKPLAKFDLTDRQQFLQACHYTNLQPLWAEQNLSKGGR